MMTRLWPQYNGCRSKLDRRIPVIVSGEGQRARQNLAHSAWPWPDDDAMPAPARPAALPPTRIKRPVKTRSS
ncbi:hypothetical protein ACBI99_18885 [Nonomuraea sp. ATR24]|uniref:hypothetical protein n=1 Tax=Nonomuraea sp. ATR24 TaxID=1676744 RepID=UPI0035C1D86D